MAEETKTPAAAPAEAEAAAGTGAAAATGEAGKRKKSKKNIQSGIVHVQATFNNTLITICDTNGNVLSWSTAGARGFKGSRKSTPFAAQVAAGDAAAKAMEHGLKNVTIRVSFASRIEDQVLPSTAVQVSRNARSCGALLVVAIPSSITDGAAPE